MTKNDDALRKTLTDLGTGVEGVGVYLQVSFKELSYSYVGRVNYSLDGVVNMSFIYNNGMVEHDHINIADLKSADGYTVTKIKVLGRMSNENESYNWKAIA